MVDLNASIVAQKVNPVLSFPKKGLDDPATYEGYRTRFYRDSGGNTVQIYLKQYNGRYVHVWGDNANESIGFTARRVGVETEPVALSWHSKGASLSTDGKARFLAYSLAANRPALEIGHVLLGTMRLERDFEYLKKHLEPLDAKPFTEAALGELIKNMEKLPGVDRERHLALLNAKSTDELKARISPVFELYQDSENTFVRITKTTFDGRNRLWLEVGVANANASLALNGNRITIRAIGETAPLLRIKIGSDSPSLSPLTRNDIFNDDFFKYYKSVKAQYDALVSHSGEDQDLATDPRWQRYERLERQARSIELLSSRQKMMAGLPNYGTYFGRDMMMSAMMLFPVTKPDVPESVISSVLRNLAENGEVDHEEGLGAQAIREHVYEYNHYIKEYFAQKGKGNIAAAGKSITKAEAALAHPQAITSNYHMVDDNFQLAVLAAMYFGDPGIAKERKRVYLQEKLDENSNETRLTLLLRNLQFVAKASAAYVQEQKCENLISFEALESGRWHAGSWRDSRAGYANGRYAMDINVIWAPSALNAMAKIFDVMDAINISKSQITGQLDTLPDKTAKNYFENRDALQSAISIWEKAATFFEIKMSREEAQQAVTAKINWLGGEEREYWKALLEKEDTGNSDIEFLAIALDKNGKKLPVAHTDIATWLFLKDVTADIASGKISATAVLKRLELITLPFPLGLLIDGVGPAVANDAYANEEIWQDYEDDIYHAPRVIWGREVNLLLLGLEKHIRASYDEAGKLRAGIPAEYPQELQAMQDKIFNAVSASGLKYNELWRYKIENGKLLPARYSTTSDIQLWNLTDIAVEFLLNKKLVLPL